jgi:hypothetical protein
MAHVYPLNPSAGTSLDAVLARLLRATAQDVAGIVAPLPARQRAHLAMFCYRRAHLHEIGFAIAATCDQHALMQAAPSNAAGNLIFAQSRERPKPAGRVVSGPRSRITLAKSASGNSDLATIIASVARDEVAECHPAWTGTNFPFVEP